MKVLYSINLEVWVDDGVYYPADIVEAVESDNTDIYKDDQSMLVKFVTKQISGLAGADVEQVTISLVTTTNTEVNE